MELSELRGLGPTRLERLRAMGICSLRDLLYTLPIRYEDRTSPTPCADCRAGMRVLAEGIVTSEPKISFFHGLSRVTLTLRDGTGTLHIVWFNQPWMQNQFALNDLAALYGTVSEKNGRRMLVNPQKVTERSIQPVYRAIRGIPAKTYREIVTAALSQTDDCCPESLPGPLRLRHGLCERNFAIRQAHFPDSLESLKIARRRLSFEQMLLYEAMISMAGNHSDPGYAMGIPPDAAGRYWSVLPFPPTAAQQRVLEDIAADMRQPRAMGRLIQGDVGCGKTAIAFGAMVMAAQAGYQALMMAPTEILAVQHFENARALLAPLGITCGLMTGSMKAAEKRKAHEAAASGSWQLIFGTHALISDGVAYQKLGLVITDEQHRFGVRQRSALQEKGKADGLAPHVLVMSATPIPRTLALILYGDLDLSVVDELPPGRTPVVTRIVPEEKRASMYGFLRAQVAAGKQAYVICPLVEDSEAMEDISSAKSTFDQLSENELKGLRLGLTWGDQPAEEKEDTLRRFSAGELDVLVSTTVVEVGVNVPNATVMVIENAERYGLSQLHQLRGRVGRGTDASWCFLLAEANERLRILTQTSDGFEIAQKDLELRGPGDLLGTRQSGEAVAGFLLDGDVRLLEEACQCMKELRGNPSLREECRQVEEEAMLHYSDRQIARN